MAHGVLKVDVDRVSLGVTIDIDYIQAYNTGTRLRSRTWEPIVSIEVIPERQGVQNTMRHTSYVLAFIWNIQWA